MFYIIQKIHLKKTSYFLNLFSENKNSITSPNKRLSGYFFLVIDNLLDLILKGGLIGISMNCVFWNSRSQIILLLYFNVVVLRHFLLSFLKVVTVLVFIYTFIIIQLTLTGNKLTVKSVDSAYHFIWIIKLGFQLFNSYMYFLNYLRITSSVGSAENWLA